MPNVFFHIDEEKLVASLKYALLKNHGVWDIYRLVKCLYFADQAHMAEYGRPIVGGIYTAMKDGPVNSLAYDYLKKILKSPHYKPFPEFHFIINAEDDFGRIDKKTVQLKNASYDEDVFSESDIEMLDQAIYFCQNNDFGSIRDRSHDSAWKESYKHRGDNNAATMDTMEILKVKNDSPNMVEYLRENIAINNNMAETV